MNAARFLSLWLAASRSHFSEVRATSKQCALIRSGYWQSETRSGRIKLVGTHDEDDIGCGRKRCLAQEQETTKCNNKNVYNVKEKERRLDDGDDRVGVLKAIIPNSLYNIHSGRRSGS